MGKRERNGRNPLSRRQALAASLAGASAFASLPGATLDIKAADLETLPINLDNPNERARIRATMIGSTRGGDVIYRLTRGHVWGYDAVNNDFTPFYSLLGCNVTIWDASKAPTFRYRMYESQLYCEFDTDKVIDEWANPFTGKTVRVHHYTTGPIEGKVAPAGSETDELATIKPQDMEWVVFGDMLYIPIFSDALFPTPFTKEEWPEEYAGDKIRWHSFITLAASIAELSNPDNYSVRAVSQYQENVTFGPWQQMAGHPGFSISRGFGEKLLSEDEIPPRHRAIVESRVPEIFDREQWGEPRDGGVRDYIKKKRG